MGADPMAQTPEEFSALIRSETKKWAKIIIQARIKPD
jgi:tripartite-type tricarboxylate transporter receptor subunit TctC